MIKLHWGLKNFRTTEESPNQYKGNASKIGGTVPHALMYDSAQSQVITEVAESHTAGF